MYTYGSLAPHIRTSRVMILRYVWSIRVEKGRYIEQERAQCSETEERELAKPDGGSYAITQPPFFFFPRVASRLGGDKTARIASSNTFLRPF